MKRIAILPIAGIAFTAALFQLGNASALDEAWGPQNRPTYTWDKPADHATFNSITDNPVLGDERNFVRIKEADTEDKYLDEVTLEVGKEYEVYIFYHNNASASLNESGKGLATGVRASTQFTSSVKAGTAGTVIGTLITPDADPTSVYDTAYMRANEDVYLRYVPNSAVLHNDGTANGTILAPDAFFSDGGAAIAHSSSYWGVIPGCNEYAGYITYRIKVDKPDFEMSKDVSINGKSDWQEEITVNPGDKLDFRITYKNTGTTAQTTVTAHDVLPKGLTYLAGSTFARSTADAEGKTGPDTLFGDGLGLGTFQAGEYAIVTYSVTVDDNQEIFPCGTTTIYNGASIATPNGSEDDKVKINVYRACASTTNVPTSLPTTGPGEVAMALVVVVVIGGGVFYFYRSQKMLRSVTAGAGGAQTPETPVENKAEEVKTENTNNTAPAADAAETSSTAMENMNASEAATEAPKNNSQDIIDSIVRNDNE